MRLNYQKEILCDCRLTIKRNNMLKVLFPQLICAGKVLLRKENSCAGV
jgi:hypothetical protein